MRVCWSCWECSGHGDVEGTGWGFINLGSDEMSDGVMVECDGYGNPHWFPYSSHSIGACLDEWDRFRMLRTGFAVVTKRLTLDEHQLWENNTNPVFFSLTILRKICCRVCLYYWMKLVEDNVTSLRYQKAPCNYPSITRTTIVSYGRKRILVLGEKSYAGFGVLAVQTCTPRALRRSHTIHRNQGVHVRNTHHVEPCNSARW